MTPVNHQYTRTGALFRKRRTVLWATALCLCLLLAACSAPQPDAQPPTAVIAAATQASAAEAEATTAPDSTPTAATEEEPVATAVQEPVTTTVPVETATSLPSETTAVEQPLPFEISLPPDFSIGVYAENVPNARSMSLSPNGTLFVGTRTEGAVYAILDQDQDGLADEVITLAQGLNMPNGVAFRDGSLYVAEVNRVLRYDDIEADLHNPPQPVVVGDPFPSESHHGWKFIRFGPDGKLYVPVGAPCNICDTDDTGYAVITRMDADGSNREVYAQGIRNTVGFDWDPQTGELWFTDNGRDLLGDDVPPDELNHAPTAGQHFGYPYCHAGTISDPEFGGARPCSDFTPPARALGPHVAALGMRFYTGDQFPPAYHNQILIAEHGSWNRSVPIGYRVMWVRLEEGQAVSYEPFASGWLREDGTVLGRPVDLLVMPDGSLLVSDDTANMIYRIRYNGDSTAE